MTGWFISLPPFWSCLFLDTAMHMAGCSQSWRTYRLCPSSRLPRESQLTTPKITGYVEPLKVWNLLSLERLRKEDTFFPSSFFFCWEKKQLKRNLLKRGTWTFRLSAVSEFLIVLYEWRVSLPVRRSLELNDSQNPFQPKIFCDSWYYQLLFIPCTLLTPLHHWSIDCSTAQAKNGWCSFYPSSKQSTPLPDAKTIWLIPVKPWRRATKLSPNASPHPAQHISLWI